MPISVHAAGKSDTGKKRTNNEDNLSLIPERGLYLVCDGVGGHASGEVASRIAVETIRDAVGVFAKSGKPLGLLELVEGIEAANSAISTAAQTRPGCQGMGSTVVAALVDAEKAQLNVAWVGDSRIYRVRGEKIEQVSRDHSLIGQQVEKGVLTAEQAEYSPFKHVITRALGMADKVEIEGGEHPIQDGDYVLLCSDGLTDMLDDEDIERIVAGSGGDVDQAVNALVDLANRKGGDDNVTALLLLFTARQERRGFFARMTGRAG